MEDENSVGFSLEGKMDGYCSISRKFEWLIVCGLFNTYNLLIHICVWSDKYSYFDMIRLQFKKPRTLWPSREKILSNSEHWIWSSCWLVGAGAVVGCYYNLSSTSDSFRFSGYALLHRLNFLRNRYSTIKIFVRNPIPSLQC